LTNSGMARIYLLQICLTSRCSKLRFGCGKIN